MESCEGRGTILAAENFNPDRAAAKLRKAMKGIGSDDRAIIDVIVTHSNSQRQEIKRKYRALYGRDLVEDLQNELGGHFEELCIALLEPQVAFLAQCLHEAMKGLGTDEKCIIEILCTQPNREIEEIKAFYKQKYNQDLEEALCEESSGYFRRLLRALLVCSEEDEGGQVDLERAERDAQRLFDGGVGRLGTDEEQFTRVLCGGNGPQIRATVSAYERVAGHSLASAVRAEFSGDARDALLAIVHCTRDRSRFFATKLRESLRGPGTDDATLRRILVSRSEIDLCDVREAYAALFGRDIAEDVAQDTSGDYRKALLRILQP
ncbi:hypothetical protein JTE90_006385 [Oedothorax gibbosus]|uniref:Annexin n=1 Tax=Oedothorax gibbosus TaxID=931172 RepID=A0AAV6VVP1_9ARAC|nr:hypothetical protein JTE90_006385 [Oedothorax gibbosus]